MKIKQAYVSWDRYYSNSPEVNVVIERSWPKLTNFKFERFYVDYDHILYRGVCGVFVEYYLHNHGINNKWDKSMWFQMKDGTASIACGAMPTFARASVDFVPFQDLDINIIISGG